MRRVPVEECKCFTHAHRMVDENHMSDHTAAHNHEVLKPSTVPLQLQKERRKLLRTPKSCLCSSNTPHMQLCSMHRGCCWHQHKSSSSAAAAATPRIAAVHIGVHEHTLCKNTPNCSARGQESCAAAASACATAHVPILITTITCAQQRLRPVSSTLHLLLLRPDYASLEAAPGCCCCKETPGKPATAALPGFV